MKIPTDAVDREQFYQNVMNKCLITRSEREAFYRQLQSYFLFGGQEGTQAEYNKIQPTILLLTSFIYSAETTKFLIQLGATVPKSELQKVPVLSQEINDLWHDSDTDLSTNDAIMWAFCYGCTIVKVFWDHGMKVYMCEPGTFGVYREDISSLEQQEAVCHVYMTSRSQLAMDLKRTQHPQAKAIMDWVEAGAQTMSHEGYPEGLQRLIVTQSYPQMSGMPAGGMTNNGTSFDYKPKNDADLVEMYELYVWDDDLQKDENGNAEGNWRIVTIADPGVVIYDREWFGIPKILPFVKVCPFPLPFYFWGMSFLANLVPLQDWRTERVEQIRRLMKLQIKPPKALEGFSGITEEKAQALNRIGGILMGQPGSKVSNLPPQMPADLFAELAQIDAMFDDTAGITHVMQGKGESGVRAKGHADLMARLSSARPKTTALRVEDALDRIATLMCLNLQQFSAQKYTIEGEKTADGNPLVFLATQFTDDFVVKVDAHSSSPIFVEDKKADAQALLEAKAIDRETFLEMFDPPGVQMLKERLKLIEKKEAEMAKLQAAFKLKEDQVKHGGK
jgi:hypothetical protein